jgi:hypothetical protein
MNSAQRAELLAAIADLWGRYPDWRLGQLVANVAGWADQDIWDVEDGQLFAAAQAHIQQLDPSEANSIPRPPAA